MHRSVVAALFIAAVLVAACGSAGSPSPSAPADPSPSPSLPSVDPSVAPTDSPSEAPSAPASPDPASPAPASPAPVEPSAEEQYLIDGVLRGGDDCRPVRDDLPTGAIAGIECAADDPTVARLGFYLFESDATMLAAYFARMDEEGVVRESGGCVDGEGEAAYTPGEGEIAYRDGCFINDEGFANYRATLPVWHVYIGILGTSDDMAALADFAWLGSRDTPGNPTLWGAPNR